MKITDKEIKVIRAALICLVGAALATNGASLDDIKSIPDMADDLAEALINKADIANLEIE